MLQGNLVPRVSHLTAPWELGWLQGLVRSSNKVNFIGAIYILETDHPRLGQAWAKNGSSSDNPSVYTYGQADGSSIQTSYRDSKHSGAKHRKLNAVCLRRICERSDQPKIERPVNNDARLILCRKLNGATT